MPTPTVIPPSAQAWTVHIDGSALPNPGRMTWGVLLVDPQGVQHPLSHDTRRTGCNNEAEALALMAALHALAQHGALEADIYSDSSILVEQLSLAHPKPIARLAGVYTQARDLLQQLAPLQVRMRWIPRHRNHAADALARAAHPAAA